MAELDLSLLSTCYAFCDPAGKRKPGETLKRVRARSAIIVVAPDHLSRIFVLYAWAKRCSTDEMIEQIFETQERFRPRIFGVEANAMQSLFADAIRRESRMLQKRIALLPVTQPTGIDKDFRIRAALQPVIAWGRLFIQEHQTDLLHELTSFPMSATKDLVDALASAIALVPQKPTRRQHDEEIQKLAAYLRNSGAPAAYIEQRISELALRKN
jgi:hypothetical protein